ncbi:SRPBCC domain-containing protein [Streptomyces sp. NPDC096057]|uniref:SRPBCC family protein n=1 Tax=Streptomyces sp. NPDC096057 TaxID=3155543 RepID=UPI00331EEDD9
MSAIRIVRDYPHPPQKVWHALTDPALIPLWTATGAGARPEGFATTVGTTFKFIAKPKPGWSGVVRCEVLAVRAPSLLRYSWQDEAGGEITEVAYRLEPHDHGTRFTYEHTGFTGAGGFFMAKILGTVRTKMLTKGLPTLLNNLDDQGNLRPHYPLSPDHL